MWFFSNRVQIDPVLPLPAHGAHFLISRGTVFAGRLIAKNECAATEGSEPAIHCSAIEMLHGFASVDYRSRSTTVLKVGAKARCRLDKQPIMPEVISIAGVRICVPAVS